MRGIKNFLIPPDFWAKLSVTWETNQDLCLDDGVLNEIYARVALYSSCEILVDILEQWSWLLIVEYLKIEPTYIPGIEMIIRRSLVVFARLKISVHWRCIQFKGRSDRKDFEWSEELWRYKTESDTASCWLDLWHCSLWFKLQSFLFLWKVIDFDADCWEFNFSIIRRLSKSRRVSSKVPRY